MRAFKKGSAFTLAEVLITLAIIGIVATLTIPSLVANYQKVQYVTGLKKSYAEITEALKLMANDSGCPDDLRCTGFFDGNQINDENNNKLGNGLKKYIKLARDCGVTYNILCVGDSYNPNFDNSGTSFSFSDIGNNSYKFITADGFSITLDNTGNNCENTMYPTITTGNISQICGSLTIDVNGRKGPNFYGRDMFNFYITNGRGPAIYPLGGSEFESVGRTWSDNGWCSASSPYGMYCAGRIMEQGWQMKY